jgi:hypothetical protein
LEYRRVTRSWKLPGDLGGDSFHGDKSGEKHTQAGGGNTGIGMSLIGDVVIYTEGQQAQSLLDFTCLESLRSNSRTMTELSRLSQKEAEMLIDLSMKASRDNDILKTLALLGLIYLPATLVSVSYLHPD